MRFQDKLQALRKERGMSQEKLAEMIGVSRQAVAKWEVGQSYPEIDKLIVSRPKRRQAEAEAEAVG
jgi:DNA-binding XRE family transcriptional regulator